MTNEHKKAQGVLPPLAGNLYFHDWDFDSQLLRTLGKIYDDGADLGECLATAFRIEEGSFESWYQEWQRLAVRLEGAAEASVIRGHLVSARQAFWRACEYYRSAEFFLREDLDDPRVGESAESIRRCFKKAAALHSPPGWSLEIPCGSAALSGYFFKSSPTAQPRPTLIITGGYDSYAEESFFLGAREALKRGYHVLIFDGPGQGQVLRRQKLYFRPDWEQVVGSVVDYAMTIDEVDPDRIVLMGRSFGGYLATRAATAEPRLAALIVDPGQFDLGSLAQNQLPPELWQMLEQGKYGELDALLNENFRKDPARRFYFQSRMETHGASSSSDYLALLKDYSARGRLDRIKCPTAVCQAASDERAGQARELYELLDCPKELISFTAEEGAGDHCELGAPALFAQRVFDWLDTVVA